MDKDKPRERPAVHKPLIGRVLAGIGLIVCVPIGAYFVSIAVGFVGIILGIMGYALGSRRLGFATIVLSTVAMFVGLLVGQGVIVGSYDETVNGIKDALQRPFYEDDPGR